MRWLRFKECFGTHISVNLENVAMWSQEMDGFTNSLIYSNILLEVSPLYYRFQINVNSDKH